MRKIRDAVEKIGGTYVPTPIRLCPLGFAIIDGQFVRFARSSQNGGVCVYKRDSTDAIISKIREHLMMRTKYFYNTFTDFVNMRYPKTIQKIHDNQIPAEFAFVLGVLATSFGDIYVSNLLDGIEDMEELKEKIKNYYI